MLSEVTAIAEAASLADYTCERLILPRLGQGDTAGVMNELSLLLQQEGSVPDVLPFYHAALNQELTESSALEGGMAMPHARLGGVKRLRFALGRAPGPIAWGSNRSPSVELVFLLAVPPTDAASYLHLRSSLAQLCRHPRLLSDLRSAADSRTILATLRKIQVQS